MTEFYLSTPRFYLIFCLLAAVIISGILYIRNTKEKEFNSNIKTLLAVVRGLAILCITILLLQPFLKKITNTSQLPLLFFVQDASSSIQSESTASELETYHLARAKAIQQLEEKYEVVTYSTGDEVRPELDTTYADQSTNLSEVFDHINSQYKGSNKAGIILASDGIFNRGASPVYANRSGLPIHTIIQGDTSVKRDLFIKRVFHNNVAYLDDQVNVLVDIAGKQFQSGQTQLKVFHKTNAGDQLIAQELINIDQSPFFQTVEFMLTADQVGKQTYYLSLDVLPGEESESNNTRTFRIEVIDAKQNITLLAAAPHPDIFALQSALTNTGNIEFNVLFADEVTDWNGLQEADLLILHQLPSLKHQSKVQPLLDFMHANNKPLWFIVGMETDIPLFNQSQDLISISDYIGEYNQTFASPAPNFNLYKTDENLMQKIAQYPPLKTPFGTYTKGAGAVALNQRIGSVDTNYPLLMLHESKGQKSAVLLGTGIWQWRIFNYMQQNDHTAIDALIQKTALYLGSREDKRKFRAKPAKAQFVTSEEVIIDAELFNANYERVNDPEARLTLSNEVGNQFEHTFSKRGDAYSLNLGKLPAGLYTFEAQTNYNGAPLTDRGPFTVNDLNLEALELTADFNMLQLISEQSGGDLYFPEQIDDLTQNLLADESQKPLLYAQSKTMPLIDYRWLFAVITLLLALEWFLRRYKGSY